MSIDSGTIDVVASITDFAIKTGLGVLFTWVMVLAKKWMGVNARNDSVEGAKSILQDLATTTVESLEQEVVGALRDNQGRLDKKTAEDMRERAVARLKALYGEDGIKDLAARLHASQDATLALIGQFIEQAVLLLKFKRPPASTLPPPATDAPFNPNVFGGMTQQEKDDQAAAEKAAAAVRATLPPTSEQA